MYVGLLGKTQLTRKLPIALRLILRGADGLMSPLKDMKVNLLLNFWSRVECTWKKNISLRQLGLETLDLSIHSAVL